MTTTPDVPDPPPADAWPPDRAAAFWQRVGRQRMTALLAANGRQPGSFERYVASLEDPLLSVSSGTYLSVAFTGIRAGFVDAAIDFWTVIGIEAGRNADLTSRAGAEMRFELEHEVSRWTVVPGLAPTLVDTVTEAVVRGFEMSRLDTGRTSPRHVRHQQRKESA